MLRLLMLAALLQSISGCHRFQQVFPAVETICGSPEAELAGQDLVAFRPVEGATQDPMQEGLEAYWIDASGQKQPMTFSAHGCLYLPKDRNGSVAIIDRRQTKLGLKTVRELQGRPQPVPVPLEKFPSISPQLNCSGKEIWTNKGFVSIDWSLLQAGVVLRPDEIQRLWPVLQLVLQSRSKAGLQQSISLLNEDARSFNSLVAIALEEDSTIDLQLDDLFGRQLKLDGGAACRVHMSTKKPPMLTFTSDTNDIRLSRGQAVRLEVLADSELYTQVIPQNINLRTKTWDSLSPMQQEAQLSEFRPGRSPVFWQEGSYVLRAFARDRAGNRSPVWERIIQVAESTMIESQLSLEHWILQKASPQKGPALVRIFLQDGRPTIRIRDLQLPPNAPEEVWQPPVDAASFGLFQSNFGINRQLIEGQFGWHESQNNQTCLSRGSNSADAHRDSYLSRMLCWKRSVDGSLQIVHEHEANFYDQEILKTGEYFNDPLDEIMAVSYQEQLSRFMKKMPAEDGSLVFKENHNFSNPYTVAPSFWEVFKDGTNQQYFLQADVGRLWTIVHEFTEQAGENSKGYVVDFPDSRYTMPFYTIKWGAYTFQDDELQNSFSRWNLRVQIADGYFESHPIMLVSDARSSTRWGHTLHTPQYPKSHVVHDLSFRGLPDAATATCYFYQVRDRYCLSFPVDPHGRDALTLYRFDSQAKFWSLVADYPLGQVPAALRENPAPIDGFITVMPNRPYTAESRSGSPMQWALLSIDGRDKAPDWQELNAEQKKKLRRGSGPLEVWGNDERLALWIWEGHATEPVRRELRFAGALGVSADLGRGLGLADLAGDGRVHMVQRLDQGFATLDLADSKAQWQQLRELPLPDFVRQSPLGWNARSMSFVSGRLLPDVKTPVFCFLALPARAFADQGRIACYADEGTPRKVYEGDLPLDSEDESVIVRIGGSTEVALATLNKDTNLLKVRLFIPTDGGYRLTTVPWVKTEQDGDQVRVKASYDAFDFAAVHEYGSITWQMNAQLDVDLEPNILHLSGQLQTGAGSNRVAWLSTNGGTAVGTQLLRAPTPELSLSLNQGDLNLDPDYSRRAYLFNQWVMDFDIDLQDYTVLHPVARRAFFSNPGFSTVDDQGNPACRSVENGQLALINNCHFFWVQTDGYLTGSWENRMELNEAYIQHPDHFDSHWTYPFWVQEDGHAALYTLRAPKSIGRDGWIVQKAGSDIPLQGLEESWQTERSFQLVE